MPPIIFMGDCEIHGGSKEVPITIACRHIVESLKNVERVGFEYDHNSADPYPPVLCDKCLKILSRVRQWNEDFVDEADFRPICVHCLDIAEKINTGEFNCGNCDELHTFPQLVLGFGKPDRYFEVFKDKDSTINKLTNDLCVINNQEYFIRGMLKVKIKRKVYGFEWRIWASVSKEVYDKYLELWDVDDPDIEPMKGAVANNIPEYSPLRGHEVQITLRKASERTKIILMQSDHELHNGMDLKDVIAINLIIFPDFLKGGYFERGMSSKSRSVALSASKVIEHYMKNL